MYVAVCLCTQIDIEEKHFDGEQYSKEHNFTYYFKTSAKVGSGINEAIYFMIEKVSTHY